MRKFPLPGGWYLDALPTGEYACLLPATHQVQTHQGYLPQPPDDPLWLVVTSRPVFRCMGQGQSTPFTWEWDGTRWATKPAPCGVWPVIYGTDGQPYLAKCAPPTGSQGWRYVAPDGTLVTGDSTIAVRRGLNEWTDLSLAQDGSFLGGQGNDGGACVWAKGQRRLLHPGACFNTRWKYAPQLDLVCASFYEVAPDGISGWIYWGSLSEFQSLPPVSAPPVEVPRIGRPLWLGGFRFDNSPPPLGNCSLAVRNVLGPQALPVIVTEESVGQVSGQILGRFVTGGTVEVIESDAQGLGHHPIVYWDARRWPRFPSVPEGSWLCVQAYCRAGESPAAFEADLRAILASTPSTYPIALVAQCYTSNTSLTADLLSLVPVYARLCRDAPQIVALLPFSLAGRATGYQDHPEVWKAWQQLAAGIPSAPAFPVPPDPVEPLPMPDQNANPSYDEFVNSESHQVHAAYVRALGHEPAIPDDYHNAWRRLRERWTHRDIIHDILGEPLEDGGIGGADRPR